MDEKLREAIVSVLMEFPSHPAVQAMRAPDYADRILAAIAAAGYELVLHRDGPYDGR